MYSEAPGNLPGTTTVQTHEDALDAKHDPWCLVGLSLLSKRKKPPGRALVAFCKNVHTDKKHTCHRSFVYLFMRGYIGHDQQQSQPVQAKCRVLNLLQDCKSCLLVNSRCLGSIRP